jgi:hypothetical protein
VFCVPYKDLISITGEDYCLSPSPGLQTGKVSRRLATAAALNSRRGQVMCGMNALDRFPPSSWFTCQSLVPPTAPESTIIQGWYNRATNRLRDSGFGSTPAPQMIDRDPVSRTLCFLVVYNSGRCNESIKPRTLIFIYRCYIT